MRSRPYVGAVMSKKPVFFDPNDPVIWLPGYRMVLYPAQGGDPVVYSLDVLDDARALTAGLEIAGNHAFELWDGLYMVSRHEPAEY